MKQVAIRGATTVNEDEPEQIREACIELANTILERNRLEADNLLTVFITMTDDIHSLNAAAAIRNGKGWAHVPFFCSQEPEITGMLPRCIRLLVQCLSDQGQKEVKHVYLNEAAKLRPDLSSTQ